jgi:Mn-containing catalase
MLTGKVVQIPVKVNPADVKYPLYRRYNGGAEYQKIASLTSVIHITNAGTFWNISFDTKSTDIIAGLINDPKAEACSRDDFEKAYGRAQWVLTQININQ